MRAVATLLTTSPISTLPPHFQNNKSPSFLCGRRGRKRQKSKAQQREKERGVDRHRQVSQINIFDGDGRGGADRQTTRTRLRKQKEWAGPLERSFGKRNLNGQRSKGLAAGYALNKLDFNAYTKLVSLNLLH